LRSVVHRTVFSLRRLSGWIASLPSLQIGLG
jgi:hypothetical protein